jgi:hypothetical protein
MLKQREMMRRLIQTHGRNEDVVCRAYAQAEAQGKVERRSNEHNLDPEAYARALWNDGERKGWF